MSDRDAMKDDILDFVGRRVEENYYPTLLQSDVAAILRLCSDRWRWNPPRAKIHAQEDCERNRPRPVQRPSLQAMTER